MNNLQQNSPLNSAAEQPDGAPPENGARLLDDLCTTIQRHVFLPPWAAEMLALWVVHTYAFELRDVSVYIGVESPEKRCGKTTLLAVLRELVNRPVVASNISPPAFFRVIEEEHPTLLIDEADTFLRGNDEIRGILNAGYNRNTCYVVRVARDPQSANAEAESQPKPRRTLARYTCWCPKIIAAIGHLPETLADRCIVVKMQRKLEGDVCARLRDLNGADLRARCARFVLQHQSQIARNRPDLPKTLNDRAGDIWEPLLALADLAGAAWPDRSRLAAAALAKQSLEDNPMTLMLLETLAAFISPSGPVERKFSRDIVARLRHLQGAGKPITEHWLAQQLKRYGLRSKTIWIAGQSAKGYDYNDILQLVGRYVPKHEITAFLSDLREKPQETEPKVPALAT